MHLLLFTCKAAIGGIFNSSHLGRCCHGGRSWAGVHAHTCILKRTKMHKERWNDTGEIQRNSNKEHDGCVSDLLCLLVELVEKFLDPAGVVWMDRLQVLNLHKPENNDGTRYRRVDCNYSNTDSHLANQKWKKKTANAGTTSAKGISKPQTTVFIRIWFITLKQ